jgi:hypothetical protein
VVDVELDRLLLGLRFASLRNRDVVVGDVERFDLMPRIGMVRDDSGDVELGGGRR